MSTRADFTIKLEPELREAFMAATTADDRPASEVVRELMRGYIEQHREVRDYDDYLRRKIAVARADIEAGRGYSNEDIEAEFSKARKALSRQAGV